MKTYRNMLAGLALSALALIPAFDAGPALAQTYPTSNPTYVPTAVLPTTTLAATGDYYFSALGVAGASVRTSALSGSLVATIQGSNDPLATANASATWTALYYLDASAPSTAPANSITANGLYIFNTAGFTRFRVHVTTLSGGSHVVTLQAAASVGPNGVYVLNAPAGGGSSAAPSFVSSTSDYPAGATPLTASATGTTAATTATLAGTTGKTTYICGYAIRSSATAAVVVNDTITGLITATMNFSNYVAVNTAGVGTDREDFTHCIPASATNTGIAVVSGAAGSGGVTSVSTWGYQL